MSSPRSSIRLAAHLTLGVLGLWACGCGGPPEPMGPAVLHNPCRSLAVVAPGATVERQAAIVDAVALWNSLGLTQLTTDDTGAEDRVVVDFQSAAPFFHGLYDPDLGTITLNEDLTDHRALTVVLAHELGHAMGLSHIAAAERGSVMNMGNTTITPTPADGDALSASWNGCP